LTAALGRLRAVLVALLATAVLVTIQGPAPAEASAPHIDRFLYALAQVESGGKYAARNATSGAYGKYQIMPANWGPWAKAYIGDARAPKSPRNQEIVARGKVHDLYHWLGSWRRTAYWWLTGSTKRTGWTDYAARYVRNVIAIHKRLPATLGPVRLEPRLYSENSPRIAYTGPWASADHRAYRNGSARQATRRGQTATFTFTGSEIAWNGPQGPTRGKARVYIDGRLMTTVDLHAPQFTPRTRIFTRIFSSPGTRTLRIEVLGTRGRPVVSIDEFIVWD
jgi:hypothetical protein